MSPSIQVVIDGATHTLQWADTCPDLDPSTASDAALLAAVELALGDDVETFPPNMKVGRPGDGEVLISPQAEYGYT